MPKELEKDGEASTDKQNKPSQTPPSSSGSSVGDFETFRKKLGYGNALPALVKGERLTALIQEKQAAQAPLKQAEGLQSETIAEDIQNESDGSLDEELLTAKEVIAKRKRLADKSASARYQSMDKKTGKRLSGLEQVSDAKLVATPDIVVSLDLISPLDTVANRSMVATPDIVAGPDVVVTTEKKSTKRLPSILTSLTTIGKDPLKEKPWQEIIGKTIKVRLATKYDNMDEKDKQHTGQPSEAPVTLVNDKEQSFYRIPANAVGGLTTMKPGRVYSLQLPEPREEKQWEELIGKSVDVRLATGNDNINLHDRKYINSTDAPFVTVVDVKDKAIFYQIPVSEVDGLRDMQHGVIYKLHLPARKLTGRPWEEMIGKTVEVRLANANDDIYAGNKQSINDSSATSVTLINDKENTFYNVPLSQVDGLKTMQPNAIYTLQLPPPKEPLQEYLNRHEILTGQQYAERYAAANLKHYQSNKEVQISGDITRRAQNGNVWVDIAETGDSGKSILVKLSMIDQHGERSAEQKEEKGREQLPLGKIHKFIIQGLKEVKIQESPDLPPPTQGRKGI